MIKNKLFKFHLLGLAYIVVLVGGIAIGLFVKPMLFPTIAPTNTPPSIQESFTCPTDEWVNCMPSPDRKQGSTRCDKSFLEWAQKNCPGFKGAAY